jgi:hypothetical protein
MTGLSVGEGNDVRQDVPGKFGKRTQAMREEAMDAGGRSGGTHVLWLLEGSSGISWVSVRFRKVSDGEGIMEFI